MDCSTPGFPVLHHFSELAQTHVHWTGDDIQPFYPLLSPSLLSFNFSLHWGLFQWVSSSHQVAKVLELQQKYFQWISGLISFRIDWFDLFAVSGTLKSLLQHNLKASILQHSAFFMIQVSHPCVTAGKSIALTIWTFVSKMMSLLFNILSRFVIAFLPRSKRKSFNFMAAVNFGVCSDFGTWENKICHCFHFFPFCLPEMMGLDAMILVF